MKFRVFLSIAFLLGVVRHVGAYCPMYYTLNESGWEERGFNMTEDCMRCPLNCKFCEEYANQSLACTSCDSGFYLDLAEKDCMPCIAGCSYCVGPSIGECGKMADGFGYDEFSKQILPCIQLGCAKCDSPFTKSCTDCKPNYVKEMHFINTETENGVLDYHIDCHECSVPHCEICLHISNETEVTCESCEEGYGMDHDTNLCVECPENCLKCSQYGGRLDCHYCSDGMYYSDSKGVCVECHDPHCILCNHRSCLDCEFGYFADENECVKCQTGCNFCSSNFMSDGVSQVCYGCEIGWGRNEQICSKCRLFSLNLLKWETGPPNCNYCSFQGSGVTCTECKPFMTWDNKEQACVDMNSDTCISSYKENCFWCIEGTFNNYGEESCQKCDSSCISCYSDSNGFCIACPIEKFAVVQVDEEMQDFVDQFFNEEYNGTRYEDYWETFFYYWSHNIYCVDDCPSQDYKGNTLIADYSSRLCIPGIEGSYQPIVSTGMDSKEKTAAEFKYSLVSFAAGYFWAVNESTKQGIKGSSPSSVLEPMCLDGIACSTKCSFRGYIKEVSKDWAFGMQIDAAHFVNSGSSKNETFELCVCNHGYQGATCDLNSNAIQFQKESLERLLMGCQDIELEFTGDGFELMEGLRSLRLAKTAFTPQLARVYLSCLEKGVMEGPSQSQAFLGVVASAFSSLWEIFEQMNFGIFLNSTLQAPENEEISDVGQQFSELDSLQCRSIALVRSSYSKTDEASLFLSINSVTGSHGSLSSLSISRPELQDYHSLFPPESLSSEELIFMALNPTALVHSPSPSGNDVYLSSDVLLVSSLNNPAKDSDNLFQFTINVVPKFAHIVDDHIECRIFNEETCLYSFLSCSGSYNQATGLFTCECEAPLNFTLVVFAKNDSFLLKSIFAVLLFLFILIN